MTTDTAIFKRPDIEGAGSVEVKLSNIVTVRKLCCSHHLTLLQVRSDDYNDSYITVIGESFEHVIQVLSDYYKGGTHHE